MACARKTQNPNIGWCPHVTFFITLICLHSCAPHEEVRGQLGQLGATVGCRLPLCGSRGLSSGHHS